MDGSHISINGVSIPPSRPPSQPMQIMRSRSNTSTSTRGSRRPKSRGSTASTQSVTTLYPQEQAQQMLHGGYLTQRSHGQPIYSQSPDEMIAAYRPNMTHPHQAPSLDPSLGMSNGYHIQQPVANSFNAAPMHPYASQGRGFPDGMPHHPLPHNSVQNVHSHFPDFDGIENQSPVPDDVDSTEKSGKVKKGSASSLANDNELRRLLQQYNGRTLQSVAAEVHKTDGAGARSEKPKQVFAMLWLQESCQKSTGSVRRDKVFSRYSHRCGNEKVPTLNPASFGKLVRIIFPNVQTRRLGVRGESKYHYVDLSLIPEEDDEKEDIQDFPTSLTGQNPSATNNNPFASITRQQRSLSMSQIPQIPIDTAEFPAPKNRSPRPSVMETPPLTATSPTRTTSAAADCQSIGEPFFTLDTRNMSTSIREALESTLPLNANGQPYLNTKLMFNPSNLGSDDSDADLELPDIHSFLTQTATPHDPSVASNLTNLYRSYCICVIESFRFCRAKPFFHHHTSFPGTMTVPVSKLLSLPALAPWIEECDMRMYRKMIRFVCRLTIQVVPAQVFETFSNISSRLVKHLIESFDKTPAHVIAAKVVPATRFVHLMKQLQRVNATASAAAAVLSNSALRTQMWCDLLQVSDPKNLIEQAQFSPDCLVAAENILRYEFRDLFSPVNSTITETFERENTLWTPFFDETSTGAGDYSILSTNDSLNDELLPSFFLEKWIQYLQKLAKRFPGHTAHCILNHHHFFWKALITEIGINNTASFHAWWVLETFLSATLSWEVEVGGFLDETSTSYNRGSTTATNPVESRQGSLFKDQNDAESLKLRSPAKRKRSLEDTGDAENDHPPSRPATADSAVRPASHRSQSHPTTTLTSQTPMLNKTIDRYKLPVLESDDSGISPVKNFKAPPSTRRSRRFMKPAELEDSGIGLGLSSDPVEDGDALRRSWGFLSSDPAEPGSEKDTEAMKEVTVV